MMALRSPDSSLPVQTTSPQRSRQQPTRLRPQTQSRLSKVEQQRQLVAVTSKLIIYSLLFALGCVSLVKMISYNVTQQSKLHLLKSEVKDAKLRTQLVDEDFQRSFDPRINKELMQESSYKVAPDQQPIVVYNPENK